MEALQSSQPIPQSSFNFKDTSATRRIFSLSKRIRAVSGGTSSSKTVSILVWLIDYCQTKQSRDKLVHVVSESFPHLEMGAMLDFQNIMKDRGYWDEDRWHGTNHAYTFETGNKIRFLSFDTYGKAHGPRRDVLFVNEANHIDYGIVDQMIVRTREITWLDWNPSDEFWFYTDMLGKREDIDFIGDGGNFPPLTYKDNEALDPLVVAEIESHKNNKAWWTVYGEGRLGTITTRIFTNWQLIDEIPHEARLERRGLDFGYSVDPTVIIDIYYYNGGYILDEICYQKGLSNKSIADLIISTGHPEVLVLADSAEPKSIDEISDHGVNIRGAVKGAGSVNHGIQTVQDQKISITRRSVKTLKAYRNYLHLVDKNGKITNEIDDSNHEWSNPMDAIRYGFSFLASAVAKEEEKTYAKAADTYIARLQDDNIEQTGSVNDYYDRFFPSD